MSSTGRTSVDGSRTAYRVRPAFRVSMALAALCAVLAAHLVTALVAGGPVAVPDVPAYLGIAQWVGGNGLAPSDLPFQPGFGLLLAPLVALLRVSELGTQGEAVHALALAVNSLAAAVAVVVAGRLGWMLTRRSWAAGAAALIAAVHPSLSSASRIAWPETLLALAVLTVALAVAVAVTAVGVAASRRAWASAGLIAGLAVALHARMVVLVAAVVLTALLCRIGRRAWASLGGGLLIGAAATACALSLTGTWPTARLSEAAQLDRGAEPILTVAGQLLALGGGTAGLGVIGLTAGLGTAFERCRRRSPDDAQTPADAETLATTTAGARGSLGPRFRHSAQPLGAALLCLALSAFGAVLLGGWTLTGSERADVLLYGRYADPWAVPLAVAALVWLAARRPGREHASAVLDVGVTPASPAATRALSAHRRVTSVLVVSAAAALIACALVVGAADSYDASPRRIMTLSFSPAWTWLGENLGAVTAAALVSTLLGVLLAAITLRAGAHADADVAADESLPSEPQPRLRASATGPEDAGECAAASPTVALGALVVAVIVLGAVATVVNHRHLADVGQVARDQVVAAQTVAEAVEQDGLVCLAHDRTSVPDYALWLYRLELPEIAHERVRLNNGDRPCSELVIADDNLAQRCTNARHFIDEPAASWSLWQLPNHTCTVAQRSLAAPEPRNAGRAGRGVF